MDARPATEPLSLFLRTLRVPELRKARRQVVQGHTRR
jgi:hypothetical protein